MSFKVVDTILSAALANGGTKAISYPTNTNAGHFDGARGHKMYALQAETSEPAGFTLSFDATEIVVTYLGSTTIPAGQIMSIQLEMQGEADRQPASIQDLPDTVALAPLSLINMGAPDVADVNGIVVSQDLTDAGVFSVSVTAAVAIAAGALAGTMDVPRNIVAAWTTTSVLTFTGEDEYGNTIVENTASGTSHTGTKAFKKITDITASISCTSLTVGSGDVFGLPFFLKETAHILAELEDGDILRDALGVGGQVTVRVPFWINVTEFDAGTNLSIPCPIAGRITKVTTMVSQTITTGGTITMRVNNTSVDGLSVVVANSAANGVIDTDVPTVGHASGVVALDDELEIEVPSAFDTGALTGYIEITPTVVIGTFVVGDNTDPTALTGDVRGTYAPASTPNGSLGFQLLVALPDPAYLGLDQFAG